MADISILTFGADPSAERISTTAIQQAIAKAQPGDSVVIPAGRYLTGAIFLKSNITLHLAEGAFRQPTPGRLPLNRHSGCRH